MAQCSRSREKDHFGDDGADTDQIPFESNAAKGINTGKVCGSIVLITLYESEKKTNLDRYDCILYRTRKMDKPH